MIALGDSPANADLLWQWDTHSHRSAISNFDAYLQLKRVPEQSLQPPASSPVSFLIDGERHSNLSCVEHD